MKRLSKFYSILLLLSLNLNLFAQDSGKSFKEVDTNIINLDRPYYGNVKPPKFPGAEHDLQGYIIDKFRFTQKEIESRAKGEVVIWIYIERDGTISQTRFDKNTIRIMEIGPVVSFCMLQNILQELKTEKRQDSRLN